MKSLLKKSVVSVLNWEARRVVKKFQPKVVAVTGSVGKTGTKDAVYTALSQTVYARKSEKSFNSEIGVPLTVLGLPNVWSSFVGWFENIGEGFLLSWRKTNYPDWLILEIGVDRPGDIDRLAWLKTDIVVFTHFPNVPVHVEYFESPEQVKNEKRKLKNTLRLEGTLVLNADDPLMQDEEILPGQHKLTYGFADSATVRGFDYAVSYDEHGKPTGFVFSAQFQEKVVRIEVPGLIGKHHVYPLLAALTVVISEGKSFEGTAEGMGAHVLAPGRMRIVQGMNGSTIIDDTYNSSPVAVQAGVEALATVHSSGRKIVILGDMLELGEFSVQEHQHIGELVAQEADVCITVGVRMLAAAEMVRNAHARCTQVESFQNGEAAVPFLHELISDGDVVFVKGSQGMRMERVVENIMLEPHSAINVLARQDSHWKTIA